MQNSFTMQRSDHGDACQRSKMATRLNSLLLVPTLSLLPNHSANYYDYVTSGAVV